MKYLIQAPGQPDAVGNYLDEAECRSVIRNSHLVPDMSTVTVTPVWDENVQVRPVRAVARRRSWLGVHALTRVPRW